MAEKQAQKTPAGAPGPACPSPAGSLPAGWDVVVVGGGPAGLAAALSARESGAGRVLLLERQDSLGGILNQCIHNGFGLHHFKTELTGPEYAERFVSRLPGSGITALCGATVLAVEAPRGGPPARGALGPANGREAACPSGASRRGAIRETPDAGCFASRASQSQPPARGVLITAVHPRHGFMALRAGAVVLAMGCRERTRGAIGIPGSRPAGVFTAGAAQLYMNIEGFRVGSRAVVLGSGDIGLIMARRLTLEGAKVLGVYELMPYSGGLARNKVQCLDDYGIPLHLGHTVTEIRGDKRVEQVVVSRVDENRVPVPGTEQVIDCDTVLLSVGLIPENELSRAAGVAIDPRTGGPAVYENMETSLPGVFACGNVAHVHDLVDFVTAESIRAGRFAALHCVAGRVAAEGCVELESGRGISYTVPQKIRPAGAAQAVDVFFRVSRVYQNARVEVESGGRVVARCKRGRMAPGEMERIPLPAAALKRMAGGRAVVRVAEEPEGGAKDERCG